MDADREGFQQYKVDKSLYLVNSDRDIYTITYSDKLAAYLKENVRPRLRWRYDKFNDETHESLPYLAMYHGLKFHFHNYKRLVFGSIGEFNQQGGFSYLERYYVERGKRFNMPPGIDDGTKNSLIWLAWNRNNFDYFEQFMTKFSDVLQTSRYDSAYWQNRFARFYLKHDRVDVAHQYLSSAIKKYPTSAVLFEGMSQVWLARDQQSKALDSLKTAVAIAKQQSDPHLLFYQQQLLKL